MPADSLTTEECEWQKRRKGLRLKSLAFGPLAGFPLAVLVAVFAGSEWPAIVIAALSVISGTIFGLRYQLSRCPRCNHLFLSVPGKWGTLWYTDRCRHCGFPRSVDQDLEEHGDGSEKA